VEEKEEEARFARRKTRFIAFSLQSVPAMPTRKKEPPYPDRRP